MSNVTKMKRRLLLGTSTIGLLWLSAPAAFSQWGAVIKWTLDGIGAVAAGIGVIQYTQKWFQSKKCSISIEELETLKLQAQTIRYSLEFEGIGLIPSLRVYMDRKDKSSWMRVKVALSAFFNDGNGLMTAINALIQKLGPEIYPGPQEDIRKLYQAIDHIRAAVNAISRLPDTPEPETIDLSASILKFISGLPELVDSAVVQVQNAIEDRRQVRCA